MLRSSFTYLTITLMWRWALTCQRYDDRACQDIKRPLEGNYFINQWIVKIKGGQEEAKQVAKETGFVYIEPMKDFKDHYFFKYPNVPYRHKMKNKRVLEILKKNPKVECADQQYVWQPTIQNLQNYSYKEMVGYEEPTMVRTASFQSKKRELENNEDDSEIQRSGIPHGHEFFTTIISSV